MSQWSTARDLKAQLQRLWERGELLRDAVTGYQRFPLRLSLKAPNTHDITHRFDEVRNWVDALSSIPHLQVKWQEVRHRIQGTQRLPESVWVSSRQDALVWLNKHTEWRTFTTQISVTEAVQPVLLNWLEKRPAKALELADSWENLLAIVTWLYEHPRPGIYMRQVDLPGIHSKFIESHRGVLSELLDLALPETAIDAAKYGVAHFAARYGFQEKPTRVRFRLLDPDCRLMAGIVCSDITLDVQSFSCLTLQPRHVFITENETNFLVFPEVRNAIVIFGAGYGWEALASARWLHQCRLHYWGDIDTHGFAILNQLRGHFPHVESLLMDRETLLAHKNVWGQEETPHSGELARLEPAEAALYDELVSGKIRSGLRLEQEFIGFDWLQKQLQALITDQGGT